MEKQREGMVPFILSLLYFTTYSRRVAATGHRSNGPIVGGNDRVVLSNRPEMALAAFLDVGEAVRG